MAINIHKNVTGMEFVTCMTPIEKEKYVEKSFLHSNETVVKHKWFALCFWVVGFIVN